MKCTPYARNRSTLYLGIAIALSATVASGNALAQQADSAPATSGQAEVQATDLDTVTVKGYRYSIEQSLEQKRNANAVVEVITAEDVGKFPDKNVADALQRVPGVVLIGGRTADDVLATADFERLGWTVRVATQDGSLGEAGLVTVPLDRELARLREAGVMPELFACGPDGLLRAVGERAVQTGCRGWLSLDKHMVCGVGACLACVQTLRRADGTEWIGRVCHDGPIFEAREIVW